MKVENEHVNPSFAIRLKAEVGGKDKVVRKSAGKYKTGKKRGEMTTLIHMVLPAQ